MTHWELKGLNEEDRWPRRPLIELNDPMVDFKGPWRELNGHRMELRSRQSAPKRSKYGI